MCNNLEAVAVCKSVRYRYRTAASNVELAPEVNNSMGPQWHTLKVRCSEALIR